MVNREHLDILKQGVKRWNKWRRAHQNVRPNLRGADLSSVNLIGAHLRGADLREANLSRATISKVDLSEVATAGVGLTETEFREDFLRGTDLSEATLCGANLFLTNLSGANLCGADLSEANLCEANLSLSNLRVANLEYAKLWNAHLCAADCCGTLFSWADLSQTDLRMASLGNANLRMANLSHANLWDAFLVSADLSRANLCGAILHHANLGDVNLAGANLAGANLSKAILAGTVFAENDLCEVKGLLEVDHRGPSIVQLHTVKLPQDGSALHFLRGIGVPDEWIDDYRARMMHPIQYHSVFISYSSKDVMLACRLHADLQDHGVRCWFAPEDMKIGNKIRSRIDEAIHLQDKFLLLLSGHAIASAWVEDEVEAALEKEQRQQREVLFPIRLDESVMQTSQAWVAKLRHRHIGDFTHWTDPQAYQKAFERLLRDLKASVEIQEKVPRGIDF
jgi:uncharacterized protein YjbI with pentapeptide repeats